MPGGIVGCDFASIGLTGGITGSFIAALDSSRRASRRRLAAAASAAALTRGRAAGHRELDVTVRRRAWGRWSDTTRRGRRRRLPEPAASGHLRTAAAGDPARRG